MDSALLFSAITSAIYQYWFVFPFMFVAMLLRSAFFKGLVGEWYVNKRLVAGLDAKEYQLFKNVTLPTEDGGSTQIDHILLSPYGLFVIETKNMQGWIFGSARQAKWTQQIYKHKSSFQNPLRQNYKHTETLREILALPKEAMHSVVIFTARAEFKTDMPENVGYVNAALKYIRSHDQVCFSELQCIELRHQLAAKKLKSGIKTHMQHVKHVKEIVKDKAQGKQTTAVVTTETTITSESTAGVLPDTVKPLFPRCNGQLLSRKNRKTGEAFLGCSSYPKCRYIGH